VIQSSGLINIATGAMMTETELVRLNHLTRRQPEKIFIENKSLNRTFLYVYHTDTSSVE
jgi:hypothetical protein